MNLRICEQTGAVIEGPCAPCKGSGRADSMAGASGCQECGGCGHTHDWDAQPIAQPEHIRAFDNIPDLLPLTLAQRAEIAGEAKRLILESHGIGDWRSLARWATVALTYEQMLRSVIAEANRVDMQAKVAPVSDRGAHVREEHHVDKDGHVVTRWNSDE